MKIAVYAIFAASLVGCSVGPSHDRPLRMFREEPTESAAAPLKDTQGWIFAALGTAPDHWYECAIRFLYQNGDADLTCFRRSSDPDAGAVEVFTIDGVGCWKAPHPHFLTGGPPFTGFGYPTTDPRDGFVGHIVDGDAGSPDNLLVSKPDGGGGVEVVSIPNADMMTDTWTFPMWIPHPLHPIDQASAAVVATSCDLPGYFDAGTDGSP